MAKEEKIYDDIKQIYMFPREIAVNTLKRVLIKQYNLSEEDIEQIIDEYEMAKRGEEKHDIDSLLLKASEIFTKNKLPIPEYVPQSKEEKIKRAIEELKEFYSYGEINKSKETNLGTQESARYMDSYIRAKETINKINESLSNNSEKSNNSIIHEQDLKLEDTIVRRPKSKINKNEGPSEKKGVISIEDINTSEARDRLIIKLITEGKSLRNVRIEGTLLSDIEDSAKGPEIKAFANLLKERIKGITESIKERYTVNFTRIQGEDIKRVFYWISGSGYSELNGKKENIKRTSIKCDGRVDAIKNAVFRDANGEYELCTMVYTIENLRNERFVAIDKREEVNQYERIKDIVRRTIGEVFKVADRDTKSRQISK